MRAQNMVKQSNGGSQLLREVQVEFTRRYPYLKIETPSASIPGVHRTGDGLTDGFTPPAGADTARAARDWIREELELADTMTIRELEDAIRAKFGVNIQVFRRSGKFWIEARMTRDWTLKQQNDHGRDLSTGLK